MTPCQESNWNQFIAWHICGQKHDMNTIASTITLPLASDLIVNEFSWFCCLQSLTNRDHSKGIVKNHLASTRSTFRKVNKSFNPQTSFIGTISLTNDHKAIKAGEKFNNSNLKDTLSRAELIPCLYEIDNVHALLEKCQRLLSKCFFCLQFYNLHIKRRKQNMDFNSVFFASSV